jgi:mono/diheme cytochrome c family protein
MPGGRTQLLLWIAAAAIATAALVTVLVREHRPAAVRHALYVVGDPQRGATLFFGEKQCSICHSINGSGGHVAPDLSAEHPAAPAMGWLATVLWNHAPGMFRQMRGSKSYPQLTSEDMADILAFLYQASNAGQRGDVAAGEKVFQDKGCATCHSVRSVGGKSAPELSGIAAAGPNEWMRAMWNHTQKMVEPITKALGHWPEFTGSEMNDLVAYVGEGNQKARASESAGGAERGWRVFQTRCIQCHSVRGNGGKLGPELGPEHDLPLTEAAFASVLWNHAPAMLRLGRENGIAMPTLQRDEMTDLTAFLASLRYVEPSGSSFVGERVFRVRGCAQCHGPEAEGTRLGPRLRAGDDAYTAVSFTAALWKHGPRMVDRVEEAGISWPTLEATDIGDLVAFLNAPRRRK